MRLMQEQYGNDTAHDLCEALCNTEPEVSIRLNFRKGKSLIINNNVRAICSKKNTFMPQKVLILHSFYVILHTEKRHRETE